jgi:ribosomal protein L11 methyltransferase
MPASSIQQHRAPKTWNKIIITVDPKMSEAVTAYLTHLSGSGLEVSASDNIGESTKASRLAGEKITAYLPIPSHNEEKGIVAKQTQEVEEYLARISLFFPDCLPPLLQNEIIREEDWGKNWKSFFTSFQVTPSLTIQPSWEKTGSKRRIGQHVIVMDPGLAFGTGHHASTQLALLLLEQIFQERGEPLAKALDIGTGSGILAMACSLFGASEVLAIDNDPDAVETARQNVRRNRLADRVTVSNRDLNLLKPGFHIVVANITHDILAELAPHLTNLLHSGGFLVLSGILNGAQEQSIHKIYADHGLQFIKRLGKDEWAALLLKK